MLEREMFEKSFQRPRNFFALTARRQWEIDEALGILDWVGKGLTPEDKVRYAAHYILPVKTPCPGAARTTRCTHGVSHMAVCKECDG